MLKKIGLGVPNRGALRIMSAWRSLSQQYGVYEVIRTYYHYFFTIVVTTRPAKEESSFFTKLRGQKGVINELTCWRSSVDGCS